MIISRTPFRISFFGGGTDYPVWYEKNGGSVLSTTINKYCYIIARHLPPFFEHKSRIVWSQIELVNDHNKIIHPSVREVLNFLGIQDGVEIHHHGDMPGRSGMGSSSSFTTGALNALYTLQGKMVDKRQLALDAIHVEQERLKENVGSQDQVAAAYGGFNRIDFGGPQHFQVHPIALPQSRLEELQDNLMIFFTGLSRHAHQVAGEQIKNTPKKEEELRKIHKLVNEAVGILTDESDLRQFGDLLHQTWMLKRGLTHLITNDRIDDIYNQARNAGAIGGKLLGAGGGGFILFFVPREKQGEVKKALKRLLHIPFRFENEGSQIIYYAANGRKF